MDSGVERQKYFKAFVAQRERHVFFVLVAGVERVPVGGDLSR